MKKQEVITRAKSAVLHDVLSDEDVKYLNAILSHIPKFDGTKHDGRYNFEDIVEFMQYMVARYEVEPGNILADVDHFGVIKYRMSAYLTRHRLGEPYEWVLSVGDQSLYDLLLKFTVGMYLAIKKRHIDKRTIDKNYIPKHKILK